MVAAMSWVIGRRGLLRIPAATGVLSVPVEVKDVRKTWARVDYLVEVLAPGNGSAWVIRERVELLTAETRGL